ncbi:MAG TPA: hypothetical protein VNZ94_07325 [Xanthobacteraceae bacterium]|nr:hypothetical protein [Xanthobacteraceae bacterium]
MSLLALGIASLSAALCLAPSAALANRDEGSKIGAECKDWARTPDGKWSPRPSASMSSADFTETVLLAGGQRVMGPKASALLDKRCGTR